MNTTISAQESPAEVEIINDDFDLFIFDDDPTEVIDTTSITTSNTVKTPGLLRRIVQRVVAAIRRVVTHSTSTPYRATVTYVRRVKRASAYTARHRVQNRWYGRQLSTSERNGSRAVTSRAAAKEEDLPRVPIEFVGWVDNFIETLREEQSALHPTQSTGRHFICS
jgi:hypothetical protein